MLVLPLLTPASYGRSEGLAGSPHHRPHFVAVTLLHQPQAGKPDSPLMEQVEQVQGPIFRCLPGWLAAMLGVKPQLPGSGQLFPYFLK